MSANLSLACLCCICGSPQCEEAYDHNRITPKELSSLLQRNRQASPCIADLYRSVDEYYSTITEQLLKQLESDRKRVRQQLKQLEFPQLTLGKASMDFVGRLACGDFSLLPSRRIIQLVEALQGEPQAAALNSDKN
jgi:hypothetical protein